MDVNSSLAHTKWKCKYHIVVAPKYRRKMFYKEKRVEVGKILRTLCEWKKIKIVEAEVCPDHVHMLFYWCRPFLESLLRFIYLDIWSMEDDFKRMDKALLDFYRELTFDSQAAVMSTLAKFASQHIYFEFLRLDWQARFHYAEQHSDEDTKEILPHKHLEHIPSTVDMLQKQIMRLFEDVLDVDDNKKKPVSEKLQAYLEKDKTHPLYAYKFQPISTVYGRVGMGSFAETLHPISIYDLIEFSLRECIKREQRMRICSYCEKYFAIPHRNTAEFCNLTVDENGYTCREVGARKRWAEKKKGVATSRVLCLWRFRGFESRLPARSARNGCHWQPSPPKNPTTFEKVDETFVFWGFIKTRSLATPKKNSDELFKEYRREYKKRFN